MKIKHGIAIAAALAFLFITGAETFAASPGRVSYQGTLRKDGRLFSGTTAMEFRITSADGSVSYWASGSTEVFVSTGLFRYALGSPNEADFAGISWKEITPYVQMKLDGAWLPAEPLYASVYSLHANTAEASTGTFTVNNGDLRLTAVSGSKGIIFPDGTAQYSAPGWAVTGSYTSFVGGVGVGTLSPETRLDVKAAAGDAYAQFWRDSAGVIRATMTAAGVLYANGSQLSGADNLGNHTATKVLQMAGFPIINSGAITANGQVTSYSSVTVTGALGLGAPRLRLAGGVELSSSAANGGIYISSNVSLSAGARYYGDGSALTGVIGNDNLGNHTLTQNLVTGAYWISYDGSPNFGINQDALGNVGIGNTAGAARLDVRGAANNYIQIWRPSGGTIVASMTVAGVLYADGSKLRNLPAGGTANRALDMASFNINNVSTVTAGYLSSPGAGVIFTTNALVMGGRLGVNTSAPGASLDVNGSVKSSSLSGAGDQCVYADNTGRLLLSGGGACGSAAGLDNLGNHTMLSNLITGSHWLSYDGSDGGLSVGPGNNAGIGVLSAATRLDVQAGSDGYVQFWRDSGGTIIASMTSTGLFYADASKLRNLPPGSDNLGDHTATTALLMAGFPINNAGAITAASLAAPRLNFDPAVEISSEASAALGAGVRISSNVYIVGYSSAAKYYGDGSGLTGVISSPDDLGNHTATQNLNMAGNEIVGVSTITLSSVTSSGIGVVFSTNVLLMSGRLGVNTSAPGASLDVNGSVKSSSLSGAGDQCVYADNTGRLLLSGGGACGSAAGLDNLGNHTMLSNLITGSHWLSFDGSDGGLSLNIANNAGIGVPSAGTRLDVQAAGGDAYAQFWRNAGGTIVASMTSAGLLYADASKMRNLPSGADNLGSHTASQNLNLASHDIINVSTITAGYLTSAGPGVVFSTNLFLMDGNLGVNTLAPQEKLHVNGKILSSDLAGAADRCVYVTAEGVFHAKNSDCGTAAGAADDLGSHIMTQNLETGPNWISYDGTNTGIRIDPLGNVSIGDDIANARLDVRGAAGTGNNYIQTWRNVAGVAQASMTVSGILYADGSKLRNLPLGADNLGSHIATTTLQMMNYPIVNAGEITANGQITTYSSVTVAGELGLGAARLSLSPNAEISSETAAALGAGVRISSNVYIVGFSSAAKYYGDGSGLYGMPSGNVIDNLAATLGAGSDAGGLDISNAGAMTAVSVGAPKLSLRPKVEISSETAAALGAGVRISSNVYIVGFSSAARYYGDGSALAGVHDNLGNHTMGQNLVVGNWWLSGDGTAKGISINSSGNVGVGINPATAKLEINDGDGSAFTSGLRFTNFACSDTEKLTVGVDGDVICSADQTSSGGSGNVVDNLSDTLSASNNAGGRGILNAGSSAFGRVTPGTRLDVQAAPGDSNAQFWRNSDGVVKATMTAEGELYADGSKLTGIVGTGGNIVDTLAATLAAGANAGGAYISNLSSAALGRAIAAASLDVQAAAGPGTYAQIWRNSSGVEVASMTAAGVLYADGSKLTGVTGSGGNIVDTLAATLAAGADAGGAYINNLSSAALGRATAQARLDVQAAGGDTYTQIWRNSGGIEVASMTAAGVLYADGSKLSGMGVWNIVDTLAATLAAGTDAGGLDISNAGTITAAGVGAAKLSLHSNVEISSETSAALGAGVRISSNVYMVGFSSAAKYYGDGSALAGVHDNLGNHIMQQNLVAGNWWLSGDGTAKGISINSDGKVGVGINPATARMEINDGDGNPVTSGLRFTNFACSSTDKLTIDGGGNVVCAADQTSSGGSGNVVDNLYDTLGAYNDAGGRSILNAGNSAFGRTTADTRLDVQATLGDTYVQFWRNSDGVVKATMTAAGELYADGSKLSNLPEGNVIDTLSSTLGAGNNAGGLSIVNSGAITANAAITTYSSMTVAGIDAVSGYSLVLSSGINMPNGTVNAGLVAAGGAGDNYFAGNVGIGTAAPGQKLSVAGGNIGLSGDRKIVFSDIDVTDNLKLQLRGGFGLGINTATLFYAADGRHSWRDANGASERMALTTAYNGGLIVNVTGNSSFAGSLGIGMGDPKGRLDVQAAGSAQTDMAQIWLNSGGVVISSMSATGVMMASRFVGDGSALAGVHDDLGNHIATKDLNLNTFNLVNVSSITARQLNVATITASGAITSYSSVTVLGELGVGAALRFGGNVEISSATGLYSGIYISTNVNLVAGAKYYVNGVELAGGSGGGNIVDTLQNTLIAGASAGGQYIIGLSSMAVGRTNAEAPLDVQAVGGNTRVQIWRSEGGAEVSSMTAAGVLHADEADLNNANITGLLTGNYVEVNRLGVGAEAGAGSSVIIQATAILGESDINDSNPENIAAVGVLGAALINPTTNRSGSQMVIGGNFRGGIAPGMGNTKNFPTMIGLRTAAWTNTSGGVTRAYGLFVQNVVTGDGAVGTNSGINVEAPDYTGIGVITNNFGIDIKNQIGFGTTKSYNIYSEGTTSVNVFEGEVRVGGALRLTSKNMSNLLTTVPQAEGEMYYCNNCSPKKIVVSTGTSAGNFADVAGGTFK